MSKKKICIVAEHYPTASEPLFPFVQQLAYSLSNEGYKCSVVAPQSLTKAIIRKLGVQPIKSVDKTPEGFEIDIFRPYILTFSKNRFKFLNKLYNVLMRRAIKKGIKMSGEVDCVYSYFWHIGLTTASVMQKSKTPLFVQASECEITVKPYMTVKENLERIKGVVCASGKNKQESLDAKLTEEKDTCIVVNGYRTDEFYTMDKTEARRKFGFPEDKFIVAFVGGFIPRKGLPQLCEAIDRFDDVYSIFVGKGALTPTCKNVLFADKVTHNEIVSYLNCADVFVLPTNAEGCCNAIIEALACGLPVVSSNKSFNDEILDNDCAIRINEDSADEIYEAIKKIKENDEIRSQMAQAALKKAETLTIERRAQNIDKFIQSRING